MFSLESYSNKAPLACSLISRNKVSLLRFRVSADAVVDVVVVIVAGVFFFQSRASSAPIKTKKKDMKCRVVKVFVSKTRMKWKTKERSLSLKLYQGIVVVQKRKSEKDVTYLFPLFSLSRIRTRIF
jgi:hypothetical protein